MSSHHYGNHYHWNGKGLGRDGRLACSNVNCLPPARRTTQGSAGVRAEGPSAGEAVCPVQAGVVWDAGDGVWGAGRWVRQAAGGDQRQEVGVEGTFMNMVDRDHKADVLFGRVPLNQCCLLYIVLLSFRQIKSQTSSSVVNLVQYFVVFLSLFQQLAIKETKIKRNNRKRKTPKYRSLT